MVSSNASDNTRPFIVAAARHSDLRSLDVQRRCRQAPAWVKKINWFNTYRAFPKKRKYPFVISTTSRLLSGPMTQASLTMPSGNTERVDFISDYGGHLTYAPMKFAPLNVPERAFVLRLNTEGSSEEMLSHKNYR